MSDFFDLTIEYTSPDGFGRFTVGHFLWLTAALAVIILLCRAYRASAIARRRRLRLGVAGALLLVELSRALLLRVMGAYDIGRLPLHLCGMAVYISALHALRGGRLTGQFLYAFCLPGAVCALLFPDWSYYPAWHVMTVSGFALHMLICAYVLMQTAGGDIVPDIRLAPRCLLLMLLLAAPVYVFDKLTDTNYMFLNWPASGSPLEWFAFLGRPGYVLGYLPIIAAAWALMYFPFRNKKAAD